MLHHPQLRDVILRYLPSEDILSLRGVDSELDRGVCLFVEDEVIEYLARYLEAKRNRAFLPYRKHYALVTASSQLDVDPEHFIAALGRIGYLLEGPEASATDCGEPEAEADANEGDSDEAHVPPSLSSCILPIASKARVYHNGRFVVFPGRWFGVEESVKVLFPENPYPLFPATAVEWTQLRHLNLVGPMGLRFLPTKFFNGCYTLEEVSMTSMSSLLGIGPRCFENCPRLKAITIDGADQLKFIGSRFAADCSVARLLGTESWVNLTEVKDGFLSNNPIREISCRWPRITQVHFGFLLNTELERINGVTEWNNCVAIGGSFLSKTNIVELQVNWPRVTTIANDFLEGCHRISHLKGIESMNSLTTIGDGFMARVGLTSIDLSGASALKHVGEDMLKGCPNLVEVKGLRGRGVRYAGKPCQGCDKLDDFQ